MSRLDYTVIKDDELKALHLSDPGNKDITNEISKRVLEFRPLRPVEAKWAVVDAESGRTLQLDRLMYNKPYSCLISGKRVWAKTLDHLRFLLNGSEEWWHEDHQRFTEWEWWDGIGHPASYEEWKRLSGI